MMFFNLHRNAIIGYKKLSNSDLGTSTGNTTHIGLFENTLEFASSHHQISSSQLIYNNEIRETQTFLNYIENPDGTFRSPKIRSSDIGRNSTVRTIREITAINQNINWYLLWFGLENEDLTFLLIEENSSDYLFISNLFGDLTRGNIQQDNPNFNAILELLNNKVNNLNFNYLQELELFSQTNEDSVIKKINPKRYDIIKAQKLFQKIGRVGEELVNIYLEKEKSNNHIKNFTWVNKSTESGFPFDFEITNNDKSIIYSDAKSTSYKFEQKIIFSSQELKFIHHNPNYYIHRVFDLNTSPKLKICNNIETISHSFVKNLNEFNAKIELDYLKNNGMKISLKPTHPLLNFEQQVNL